MPPRLLHSPRRSGAGAEETPSTENVKQRDDAGVFSHLEAAHATRRAASDSGPHLLSRLYAGRVRTGARGLHLHHQPDEGRAHSAAKHGPRQQHWAIHVLRGGNRSTTSPSASRTKDQERRYQEKAKFKLLVVFSCYIPSSLPFSAEPVRKAGAPRMRFSREPSPGSLAAPGSEALVGRALEHSTTYRCSRLSFGGWFPGNVGLSKAQGRKAGKQQN